MGTILTIIASVLACAIGLGKYFGRKNEVRRNLAAEAGEKLNNAQKTKSKSDLLDAWDNARRMQ